MELLLDLFLVSVQYSCIAVVIYCIIHACSFFDEWRKGRPDAKIPAKSMAAVQIYGMIAAGWLPIVIFLMWRACEYVYNKVIEKIHN